MIRSARLATPREQAKPDGRELRPVRAWAVVAGIAVTAGLAWYAHLARQLLRPLWLDEVVTQLEATSPRGVMHAMRAGVDFHPPVYATLARISAQLLGSASPISARLPALIAAIAALAIFGASMRARHSWTATLSGMLTLAAHPLFLPQGFEARPYALWLLGTVLSAEALRERGRARSYWCAAAAAFLCSVHYFGVLTLTSVAVGAAVSARVEHDERWYATLRRLRPLAAGVFAFTLVLPLAASQLAAIGGRSWVAPPTAEEILFFLRFPWTWRPAAVLIVAGFTAAGLRVLLHSHDARGIKVRWSLDATESALLATAFVPVVLVVVTLVAKPVLVLRYSAPAALAVATLTTIGVDSIPGRARWLAVAWLVRAVNFSFASAAAAAQAEAAQLEADVRAVTWLSGRGIATISPSRHEAYRISMAEPATGHVAWLQVSDSIIDRAAKARVSGLTHAFMTVERDFGRATHMEFAFPTAIDETEVRRRSVVALYRDVDIAAADSIWLPGFVYRCDVNDRIAVYTSALVMPPSAARPRRGIACQRTLGRVPDPLHRETPVKSPRQAAQRDGDEAPVPWRVTHTEVSIVTPADRTRDLGRIRGTNAQ